MLLSFFQLFTAPLVTASKEAAFYQGQPITWMLLLIILGLVGFMWRDMKNEQKKLWGHGHKLRMECSNHTCKAEISTEGVLTREGG